MFNKNGEMLHLPWNPFRQGKQEQQTPTVNPGVPSWIYQMRKQYQQIQEPSHEFGKHNNGLGSLFQQFNVQTPTSPTTGTAGQDTNIYGTEDMNDFYDYLNSYRYY